MTNGATLKVARPRHSFLAALRDYPFPMVATAVVFAVLGGAILSFVTKSGGGDEPPIRVKNGSLDLELMTAGSGWEPAGPNWKAPGTRPNNTLNLVLVSKNCGFQEIRNVNALDVVYHPEGGANLTFNLKAVKNHTMVNPPNGVSLQAVDSYTLRYPGQGYLLSVSDGHTTFCSFDSADQLQYLEIQ